MSQVLPYASGQSKKAEVQEMFDNISGTYDGLNRVLSLGIDQGWRRKLIARLKLHQPNTVLDVATGTADLALAEAKATEASIIGLDLAEQMLAVGRKKVAKQNLQQRVVLVQGDSEALPYPDGHFDAVTVAFGVRNFENLEQGLEEIKRVLRPGGLFLVLEFGRPKSAIVRAFYNFYSFHLLPFVGKLVSKDARAYSYLPESVRAFPSGEEFVQILHRVGFVIPSFSALTFGICMLYEGKAP